MSIASKIAKLVIGLLVASSFTFVPQAAQAVAPFTDFSYTTDADNNVTVTGCNSSCPTNLVIPSTLGGKRVKFIGNYAFYGKNLISVTIPDSVTEIRESAFEAND